MDVAAGQMGICTAGETPVIVGLDPGRDKTGWALVRPTGELILSGIFSSSELEMFLKALRKPSACWEEDLSRWIRERCSAVTENETIEYLAIGDGTGGAKFLARVERFGMKAFSVDEKGTTFAARKLYWRLHRPVWWQRCLPPSLRVPPRVLDDLAAWAIVLRSINADALFLPKTIRSNK